MNKSARVFTGVFSVILVAGVIGLVTQAQRTPASQSTLEEQVRAGLLTLDERELVFQESGVSAFIADWDDLDRDTLILVAQKTELAHLEKRLSFVPQR